VLLHLSLATVGMFLLTLRLWRRISGGAPTGLAARRWAARSSGW
jgi:hypothetical protein